MIRIFLIVVSLFLTLVLQAQRTLEVSYEIEWTDVDGEQPLPVGTIGFDNAMWEDEIPFTIFDRLLESSFTDAELLVSDMVTETISEDRLTNRQQRLLPGQVVLEPRVAKARNKYYLQIRIVPVWRDAETQQIKRLISFEGTVRLSRGRTPGQAARDIEWEANSALAEGTFYKIAITEDGVHRIDRSFLQSLGVNVNSINPQNINVYGNGGAMLPFENEVDRPNDPQKNAIFIQGEGDGSFDEGDYLLFYGLGPDSWDYNEQDNRFRHTKHLYSDSAFYFIRVDDPEPLRISNAPIAGAANVFTSSFADRAFIENELVNVAKSGRQFYGNRFVTSQPVPYTFSLPNLLEDTAYLDAAVAIRSLQVASEFEITAGGEEISLSPPATGDGVTSNFVNLEDGSVAFVPSSGNSLSISVQFDPSVADAEGWLDFLSVNVRRSLSMAGGQLTFRDPELTGNGNIAQYVIQNGQSVFQLWDITDPISPQLVETSLNGGELSFTAPADELREFIAFGDFNYRIPEPIGAVANQNLHALNDIDLVVLTNNRFLSVAEEYMAIHEDDGLEMALVTTQQVYNEFSSGNPDPTAIKMLMKMLYDSADGNSELAPKYLQIIGDGSFRNRNLSEDASVVMTFQSRNSISPVYSYVTDDYFGFLEDQYGEGLGDKMSIGVGRIPCETVSGGLAFLNKVRIYRSGNTNPNGDAFCLGDANLTPYGSWRNIITLVSDDMDGNGLPSEVTHMINSDEHGNTIYDDYNDYDVVKIYMDAYQQVSTPGGERYAEAEDAVRRRVENGSLIVNYIGHGGERGWAHERVLNTTTIQEWNNLNRLPLFVTATCELARFDDPEFKSAGELLVMNPQGGAIGMLTTTRIVFSGSNQQLNRAFFDVALEDEAIEELTLGFITMETKNDDQVTDSSNKRNFSLLGDVALELVYPKLDVYTTEINGLEIDPLAPDTIRSLQEVTIKGYVGNAGGDKLTDFNGFVYPTVFDKKSEVTTLNNDGAASPYEFEVWKNVLYKGKASVTAGDFTFSFVVPRDIAFDFGTGRISYYTVAGDDDGHGHSESFAIGGALEGAELNDQGPEVNLYLNDSTFVFGGITDESPILFAQVFDDNGINTVGSGIGHDIKAVLDENTSDPLILNDFYESDLDTYKSGSIRYQLSELTEGLHTLSLKVWDVHNNSSESFTEFVVASSAELALDHVLNYPNPFTTRTEFMFEHNQACEFLDVSIQVFTVGGKMVKSINRVVHSDGFRSEPIEWDGRDDFGDAIGRGVYVYRVKVRTPEGQTAEKFEKLVLLR